MISYTELCLCLITGIIRVVFVTYKNVLSNSALCFTRHYEDFVPFLIKRKELQDLFLITPETAINLLPFTT